MRELWQPREQKQSALARNSKNQHLIQQTSNNVKPRGGGFLPSSSCSVTVQSTYSHQCFPSVETGISQLDHLQARWMHTQATTVGLYCRQKVVRCKLQKTIKKQRRGK